MNFSPFLPQIPSAGVPTIHQFAAKLGYDGSDRYSGVQFAVAPDGKYRQEVVVVSSAQPAAVALTPIAPIHTVNSGVKYQAISSTVNLGNATYTQAYEPKDGKRECREEPDLVAMMQQQEITVSGGPLQQGTQQLLVVLHQPKEAAALARAIKQEGRDAHTLPAEFISIGDVSETWQLGGVAEYLSALPLPLHSILKPEPRPQPAQPAPMVTTSNSVVVQTNAVAPPQPAPKKKKKKKKQPKEKKPRPKPGEIRLTTALDGSTLYCCPECHMAYPERGLLEQHLLGHTMERRFICDICNAALKRKDHLTRHKQSHNPERPHVCSVCLKAFKRKEQLTLHFVIHSGEKRHVCHECGKGFYRKDHLRKHTRSHIARRVKAELCTSSAARTPSPPLAAPPTPAPAPAPAPAPS